MSIRTRRFAASIFRQRVYSTDVSLGSNPIKRRVQVIARNSTIESKDWERDHSVISGNPTLCASRAACLNDFNADPARLLLHNRLARG